MATPSDNNGNQGKRLLVLDRTKGLCVLLMLLFSAFAFFPRFGILHEIGAKSLRTQSPFLPDVAIGDFMTPGFLFLIGMSYVISFRKRIERFGKRAYLHYLSRYTLFLGLGSMLVSLEKTYKGKTEPFLLRFLFFLAAALALAVGILWVFVREKKQLGKTVSTILGTVLLLLGILSIFYGIKDTILLFTMEGSHMERYNASLMHWSILHVLGMTGLWGVLFIGLPTTGKIVSWVVLSVVLTLLQMNPYILDTFSILVLGGFAGTMGWTLVLLGGMIFMELYLAGGKGHWKCLSALLAVTTASVPAVIYLESNARAVSMNFILLSLALYGLLFILCSFLDSWSPKFQILSILGRNPLVAFGIGGIMKIILILWSPSPETPVIIGVSYMMLSAVILFSVLLHLEKKGKNIRL